MKIKSSFKDYYDSVGLGLATQDKSYQEVTYVRIPQTCIYETETRFYRHASCGCIFVCGRAYPFLFEEEEITEEKKEEEKKGVKILKVVNKFVPRGNKYYKKFWFSNEEYELGNKQKKTVKPKRKRDLIRYEQDEKKRIQDRQNFFEYYKGKDFTTMHVHADSPLILTFFCVHDCFYKNKNVKYELIKNPCLKEFDFARMMSSTTIYQEIEMFLGNELVKDAMPQSYQSDIDKIISHGFDPKISFRKRSDKIVR